MGRRGIRGKGQFEGRKGRMIEQGTDRRKGDRQTYGLVVANLSFMDTVIPFFKTSQTINYREKKKRGGGMMWIISERPQLLGRRAARPERTQKFERSNARTQSPCLHCQDTERTKSYRAWQGPRTRIEGHVFNCAAILLWA